MADTVIDVGPLAKAEEMAFLRAVDRFARWREETSGTGWMERDAPDLIIKTVCGPDGRLSKALIFQQEQWASVFLRLWREGRAESLASAQPSAASLA